MPRGHLHEGLRAFRVRAVPRGTVRRGGRHVILLRAVCRAPRLGVCRGERKPQWHPARVSRGAVRPGWVRDVCRVCRGSLRRHPRPGGVLLLWALRRRAVLQHHGGHQRVMPWGVQRAPRVRVPGGRHGPQRQCVRHGHLRDGGRFALCPLPHRAVRAGVGRCGVHTVSPRHLRCRLWYGVPQVLWTLRRWLLWQHPGPKLQQVQRTLPPREVWALRGRQHQPRVRGALRPGVRLPPRVHVGHVDPLQPGAVLQCGHAGVRALPRWHLQRSALRVQLRRHLQCGVRVPRWVHLPDTLWAGEL
jgi:hypothetical protein